MNRKKIALLSIFPEGEYQQRVMPGIFSQCEKYGYDVVVVTPLFQISSYNKDYVKGELNIFELINFDLFDGVIITPIPMTEDQNYTLTEYLLHKIKSECKKPVVSIDMPFGDYPTVYTDDKTAFFHITEHLIEKHGCKNISVLGGLEKVTLTEDRLQGISQAMEKHGLTLNHNQIYPGDFWYTSGELLGGRYVTGELPLPDAVICLSDHMAIGLTNFLIKHGIKVPDQLIVTGYEGFHEAAMNNPPITTYTSDQRHTGQLAVNKLHYLLEPDAKEISCEGAGNANLCLGGTCGCPEDINYTRRNPVYSQLNLVHNFQNRNPDNLVDMGMLLESYMSEKLTATFTPEECLARIYESKYLLRPYEHFYLCLNENWVDSSQDIETGYSDKINLTIFADRESKTHGASSHIFFGHGKEKVFKKSEMLPALKENFEKPQIFYFVPVHFSTISLGYAVLQNDLENPFVPGMVFRTFIRNINNALEMSRTKYQIGYMAEHDAMTDLYNRRGMLRLLREKSRFAKKGDKWFVIVLDMDGLKARNDEYGHREGDRGIINLAKATYSMANVDEFCVRAGGDEFYLIGLGKYSEADIEAKLSAFDDYMAKKNAELEVPVSASLGYALGDFDGFESYRKVLEKADEKMYDSKSIKKLGL